jgi:hypothetical protein
MKEIYNTPSEMQKFESFRGQNLDFPQRARLATIQIRNDFVDLCYVFPWISSWINLWTKLELMDKIRTYGQN